MKFSFALLTAINLCIAGLGIVLVLIGGRPTNDSFDASVASLVVNERLANLSFLKPQANLQISQSCAEQRGAGGLIVGKAEALSQVSLTKGVLMDQNTRFSYKAALSANCNKQNLNCYDVDSLDVSGSRILSPRL
jgi:hypothetical protein